MEERELTGIAVSPGHGTGPAAWMVEPDVQPSPKPLLMSADEAAALVAAAVQTVQADLMGRAGRCRGAAREVVEMTAALVADPALLRSTRKLMVEQGLDPASAVWQAAEAIALAFEERGGLVADRAADIRDIRNRLVAHLTGTRLPGLPQRDHPYVLVAEDLTPADAATLDPAHVVAVATALGGPTSHTAILAREFGIPAVVALGNRLGDIGDDEIVGVDGARGTVTVGRVGPGGVPSSCGSLLPLTGRTADGHRVELLATVGLHDVPSAAAAGAEGIGLLRTEDLFVGAAREPDLETQEEAYGVVFAAFAGRKVVVRTLDTEHPLRFLHHLSEPNPALGVRGVRTAVRDPEVLSNQLEAIARASRASEADVWVMAPMVATVAEAEDFVVLAHAAGLRRAGVLVEVPSAALLAGPILARADFASIGTDDLTQYTLAADRAVGDLGHLADSWDPAVLQLVDATCRAGSLQDRPVGVSGKATADAALAVVLVGLGVSSLSTAPAALGRVSAVLAGTTQAECQRLAGLALACESAADARATVRSALPILEDLGL